MAGSKGLVSTAGFESVCEAMYLGKPVFLVPVEGHFEQYCNARDAHKAGAGIFDSGFNIDTFVRYVNTCETDPLPFRNWMQHSKTRFLTEINKALDNSYSPSPEFILTES